MTLSMSEPATVAHDERVRRQSDVVAALARRVARACAAVAARGHGALRMRRPHRLSAAAAGGGAARDRSAGGRGAEGLPCAAGAGGGARCRHRAVRRRAAACARRDAVAGQVQPHRARRSDLARTAVVQCGVRNAAISEAAARHGLYYAPDPSSQIACTIGGNVAENSGGVHCLKYGLTLHNVLQGARLHGRRRADRVRRRRARRTGPGPAGAGGGQRGHAGRHHRGHRQAAAQAASGALPDGQLRRHRQGRRRGGVDHRRRPDPGRAGDDGQADDGGRRGLRARRLRPRRRGDPAVRERRHARRGRRRDRAHAVGAGAAAAPRGSK